MSTLYTLKLQMWVFTLKKPGWKFVRNRKMTLSLKKVLKLAGLFILTEYRDCSIKIKD